MSVEIFDVIKNSPAYKAELKKGDKLVSVDGNEINDVLDYMFYTAYDEINLEWEHDGKRLSKKVFKSEYDDLGLEFESFLMDKKQSCKNKCVFCFIDQMPPG
ncbi:MAG: PDZ domain-containing protein, partial [Oscillospiraceae bacterium]|nr:PDZ domain-containing protein [Oscillospiraceae bacterium]